MDWGFQSIFIFASQPICLYLGYTDDFFSKKSSLKPFSRPLGWMYQFCTFVPHLLQNLSCRKLIVWYYYTSDCWRLPIWDWYIQWKQVMERHYVRKHKTIENWCWHNRNALCLFDVPMRLFSWKWYRSISHGLFGWCICLEITDWLFDYN